MILFSSHPVYVGLFTWVCNLKIPVLRGCDLPVIIPFNIYTISSHPHIFMHNLIGFEIRYWNNEFLSHWTTSYLGLSNKMQRWAQEKRHYFLKTKKLIIIILTSEVIREIYNCLLMRFPYFSRNRFLVFELKYKCIHFKWNSNGHLRFVRWLSFLSSDKN